jgi:hypothetical protein
MQATVQSTNSNNNHDPAFAGITRIGLPSVTVSTEQLSDGGVVMKLQTGLFRHGYERAAKSGTTKPVPDEQLALEEHGRAMARDTASMPFDPTKNPQDAMLKSEYERDLERRHEFEKGIAYSKAHLREAEFELARTPRAGEMPNPNQLLLVAFVVAIGITVAPTLHDFVFRSIPDDLLAWFCALTSAGFMSAMITLSIVHGRHTSWTRIGTFAGVTLGIGLCLVRLSSAEGMGEKTFAYGLTTVEIAEVLLLEALACSLRRREEVWGHAKAVEDRAVHFRDAELANLARCQAELKELDDEIHRFIQSVADRQYCSEHLPELETVAVKAVRDGYSQGIADNIGHLRGASRRAS